MRRRDLLALSPLLAGCAARHARVATPVAQSLRLPRVRVGEDRIIRTVTGLRPFRPSGFVVRAERIGDKLVVHNYGHGGGGITLSWGTSYLAVREVLKTESPRVAVIGAGAVGLATARLLLESGRSVAIYAKALPPETTSNIAGGQWLPYSVYDHDRVTPEFRAQFLEASQLAYRRYQLMAGPAYGIRWMPNYSISDEPPRSGGLTGDESPLRALLPELRTWPPGTHPFPGKYVRQFDSMFIHPGHYLDVMLREIRIAGAQVQVREIKDVSQVSESVVVNCTGLGARELFHDEELTPIKGQLTVLLPQPEIEYATLGGGGYMFPRQDGIILGGTHDRGVWDLTPDREVEKRIVAAHKEFFDAMKAS